MSPCSSSSINKHWEAELAALKGNNAKLTAALLESTANVKQWKQQLAAYQEEAERLHKRVLELYTPVRCRHSSSDPDSFRPCVHSPGDGAGVRERPNDCDQISQDRTEPDHRRAGAGFKGQRGGGLVCNTGLRTLRLSDLCVFWVTCYNELELLDPVGDVFECTMNVLFHSFQELEQLKAEVESANEFQSQKDSLTQKLQVSVAQWHLQRIR